MKRNGCGWIAGLLACAYGVVAFAQVTPVAVPPRLTLAEVEGLVLERNHELLVVRRNVAASEADLIGAGQRPNPNLTAGVGSIRLRGGWGSGTLLDKRFDTVVGLDQLIERGGKRELRTAQAEHSLAASRGELTDASRQALLAVRVAYYAVAREQHRVRIAGENAELFDRTLAATELRHKAGDVAAADVARIRVDALRAWNDARAARGELERARAALAYLIGAQVSDLADVDDRWPALGAPPTAVDASSILSRRPDVAAAQSRVAAAERGRDLARARRTRDVTVALSFERFPGDLGSNNSIGVGVSVPLLVNHAFEGEIRRAEVELDAAQEALARVRALALADASRAGADLASARDRLARFRGPLLAEAERAAQAAEFAYTRGALGVLDLLDARRTLRATRLDAAAAEADHAVALVAWRAAVAGPEQP